MSPSSWEGASTLNLCRVLHYRLVSSAELACTLAHTKTDATILLPNLVPPPGPTCMCSLGLFSCCHYLCPKTGVESVCLQPEMLWTPFPFLGKGSMGAAAGKSLPSFPCHSDCKSLTPEEVWAKAWLWGLALGWSPRHRPTATVHRWSLGPKSCILMLELGILRAIWRFKRP